MTTNNQTDSILIDAILSKNAVLFLGAGAVATSKLKDGSNSPLGNNLAKIIHQKFYPSEPYENESLQIVSSMVNSEFGNKRLFEFLQDIFSEIKPSDGLKKLTKLKWANIYTTNIDRAIETSYATNIDRAQNITTIVGVKDVSNKDKNTNVNLYKLHGCISRPETSLVFSLEEYATYKEPHLKLFNQLSIDLVERPVIFIGYSMLDSNFQDVWNTVTKYCGTTSMTNRYFFISPKIKPSLRNFLESKKFICYEYGLDEFATHISNLTVGRRTTLRDYYVENTPNIEIFNKASLEPETRYNLSQNYFFPRNEISKNLILNKNFYKGSQPNWSDIKHDLDISRDLVEDILFNFNNWYSNPKFGFWLITGRAGDGKSTLLKRLSVEIANRIGESLLFAKAVADLSSNEILELYDKLKQPIVIVVDNTTDRITKINLLISELRAVKAKILIIGASRNSDWHANINDFYFKPTEFNLTKLSDNEINLILEKLEKHDSLYTLKSHSLSRRFEIFKEKANRELIVAMREATMALNFEEIIANEYTSIKSEIGRKVYLHICLINQFRYKIPQSLLVRILNLDYNKLYEEVFKYTKDIIFSDEDETFTDILLSSRHAVISEIVAKIYFSDDIKKVEFLKTIFKEYIPSNPLETSLVKKIYHHTTIRSLFEDAKIGTACYDQLIIQVPDDYYLLQQKSLFLINYTEKFDEAKEVIKDAIRLNPNGNVLHHTHGTILMKQALFETDIDLSKYYLEEGKRILIRGARKNTNNIYNYHTLINYLISWYKKDDCQSDELIVEIQNLIDEATFKNPNDTLLLTEYGKVYQLLKDSEKSKDYFNKAIEINPRNMAARYLLTRIFMSEGEYKLALNICDDGIKLKKDEVSINRLRFELLHIKDDISDDFIINEYEIYLSNFPKDNFIKLCYASYLYTLKKKACDKLFNELRYSEFMSYTDKLKINYEVNKILNCENFIEVGFVATITPVGYYLKSERFDSKTMVYLSKSQLPNLRKMDRVKYNLLFNYLGGFANQAEKQV